MLVSGPGPDHSQPSSGPGTISLASISEPRLCRQTKGTTSSLGLHLRVRLPKQLPISDISNLTER